MFIVRPSRTKITIAAQIHALDHDDTMKPRTNPDRITSAKKTHRSVLACSVASSSSRMQVSSRSEFRRQSTRTGCTSSKPKLTSRGVRTNPPSIATFLRPEGLHVMRRRGVGVWVSGDEDRRQAMLTSLGAAEGPRVLDGDDRKLQVLAALLDASPHPVHIGDFEEALGASRPTVRRDVRAAEAWLEGHHLHLQRLPGVGIVVRGSEDRKSTRLNSSHEWT